VLTRDEMLDDITLYWLTNTGASGARRYRENNANNFNAVDISLPATPRSRRFASGRIP
jgi:hypothetical protein